MNLPATEGATVALVDPVWVGHHPTYFRAFIEAFLDNGTRVLALCPHPEELGDLTQAYPDKLALASLGDPEASPFFQSRDHDPVRTLRRWQMATDAIGQLEQTSGWRADFVFFAWLDSYLRFMMSRALADRILGRPWCGLYFRNQHLSVAPRGVLSHLKQRLKGDFVMRSPACRLISSVDESTLSHIESYTQKPVLLMPDITNEASPDPSFPLARKIRELAQGRKIIGMVGLEKRKGFLTLLRIARRAASHQEPWFFAFTGTLWWETLTPSETSWLKHYLANKPENVYLDPEGGSIPDGGPYNGVASTFDIFFAAYLNSLYNGSSNGLTKASLLRRPVVVTEGACLEERTKAYRLGLAIPEDDEVQGEAAIRHLLAGTDWEGQKLQPRYEDYFALHSHEKLAENLRVMVSRCSPLSADAPFLSA